MARRRAVTFYYDDETGDMSLLPSWNERFTQESTLLQADVLRDILFALVACYEASVRNIFPESGQEVGSIRVVHEPDSVN